MRSASTRFLYLLYCAEAGLVLLVAPWRPIWDRVLVPGSAWWSLWNAAWWRATVSSIGAVLIVQAAHDVWTWKKKRAD